MVGLKRSRLYGLIDSSKDVGRCRNVKPNSGRDLITVGLEYFLEGSVSRDARDIEDLRKELQHNDLVDSDYFDFLTSDLMSFKKTQDKKGTSIDGTNYDPQYEMFLSCLKPYGTSCILEVSETNGLTEPIIYELCESDELLKLGNRVLRSHNKCFPRSKDCLVNSDGSDSLCRVGLQENVVKVYPSRSKNKVTETKKVESNKVFRMDDDYAGFLSSILTGEHGVCFSKPGLSDDVIIIESDDDDDDDSTVNPQGVMSPDFRKDLIELLRQPYNDKELKKLDYKIHARKPIDRHMDLRNGRETSVPGEKLGKSYLDPHPDLKRLLKKAEEDSYEKLNLLRGFFFWLVNLARDGAFKPWVDTKCLAVLPQKRC